MRKRRRRLAKSRPRLLPDYLRVGAETDPRPVKLGRGRGVCALARRAGELWACHGTPARGAGAVGLLGGEGNDHARGFVALAEAFQSMADRPSRVELGETLFERGEQVDRPTTLYALRCLVGLVCRQTGETPRSILESEFVKSPSDDFWRANALDVA